MDGPKKSRDDPCPSAIVPTGRWQPRSGGRGTPGMSGTEARYSSLFPGRKHSDILLTALLPAPASTASVAFSPPCLLPRPHVIHSMRSSGVGRHAVASLQRRATSRALARRSALPTRTLATSAVRRNAGLEMEKGKGINEDVILGAGARPPPSSSQGA